MHKDRKAPLVVSGIIFSLFALIHLIRLFVGWNVIVGTFSIPLWWSGLGFVIAGILAAWMFKSSCCDQCHHNL